MYSVNVKFIFQDWVPQRTEKKLLYEAGLGEKRITFTKSDDHESFIRKLEEAFPKLVACGGIELMRTSYSNKIKLELIRPPTLGYNVMFLAEESNLGQALCYVRPVQIDLDTAPVAVEVSTVWLQHLRLLITRKYRSVMEMCLF